MDTPLYVRSTQYDDMLKIGWPETSLKESYRDEITHIYRWDDHVSAVAPTSLDADVSTKPIYRSFHRGHFDLGCTGSETIVRLFAHIQVQALNITHTLLTETPEAIMVDGDPAFLFPEPKASSAMLSPTDRDTVEMLLDEVISHLGKVNLDDRPVGTDGKCYREDQQRLPTLPGYAAKIFISKDLVEDVEQAFAENNTMAQQYYMYFVVRQLVHEFGHALEHAVSTYRGGNKTSFENQFIGDGHTPEMGFELENRIFGDKKSRINPASEPHGGRTIGPDRNQLDFVIISTEWPSPPWVNVYKDIKPKFPTRGDLSSVSREWKYPFEFINRMFQDSFWSDELASNAKALHPPKEIGFLKELAEPTSLFDQYLDPADPRAGDFVPPGYQLEPAGLITRISEKSDPNKDEL